MKSVVFWLAIIIAAFGIYVFSGGSTGTSRTEQKADVQGDALSPTDIAAIKATSERWEAAVRAGRWEDAAATFTEDAILRFPDVSYEGRAAILAFHQTMAPWKPARVLHIDEIEGRGDMAFVTGHSTIAPDGGGQPVVISRYLDVRLRQADGTWLFYRDMVSPVPQPATKRETGG
jgi:uncharacterized protein (TIGR02246 family)